MIPFIFYVTIAAFTIMLASLSGAVFAWKTLGDWLRPRLPYFVALAVGVFAAIILNLGGEVIHENFSYITVLAFIFGGLLLEGITRLLPKDSHHHHHGDCEQKTFSSIDARRVLVGDAIHNVHDGLTLVPAFLISPVIGIGTTLGILLHEIVQEIAEFFILKEAGYTTRRALLWNFAVSATILIGVVCSLLIASIGDYSVYLIAFSAGGFVYILFRDLLPSVLTHAKRDGAHHHYFLMMTLGFALMMTVSYVAPHEHNEDEEFPLPDGFGLATLTLEEDVLS